MYEFDALFAYLWTAGSHPNEITGKWAEDGTRYTITCPEQLRDTLIKLQNRLYAQFEVLETLTGKKLELEIKLKGLLGG